MRLRIIIYHDKPTAEVTNILPDRWAVVVDVLTRHGVPVTETTDGRMVIPATKAIPAARRLAMYAGSVYLERKTPCGGRSLRVVTRGEAREALDGRKQHVTTN